MLGVVSAVVLGSVLVAWARRGRRAGVGVGVAVGCIGTGEVGSWMTMYFCLTCWSTLALMLISAGTGVGTWMSATVLVLASAWVRRSTSCDASCHSCCSP